MSRWGRWVQITAGNGPAECAWVVPRVLRNFCAEAERSGVTVELLQSEPGPLAGTLDSVLLSVEGQLVGHFLSTWVGTIQWVEDSPFRAHCKRRNWFVGVNVLSAPVTPSWSPSEVRVETLRASGPGGQHVNKTESAVRVTHVPTGIAVLAREERSQHANRRLAFARLEEALAQQGREAAAVAQRQRWSKHQSLERGNPVRVFRNGKLG